MKEQDEPKKRKTALTSLMERMSTTPIMKKERSRRKAAKERTIA